MSTKAIASWRQQIHHDLEHYLSSNNQDYTVSYRLYQAMRYGVLSGGKRFRPLLVYAVGHMLGAESAVLRQPACAIEFIHCYSLIHDDLPAMDDDEYRRGKPTCHTLFGEGMAILAGDALQTLAFELLAEAHALRPDTRLSMIRYLSQSIGVQGMAGGQAIDILTPDKESPPAEQLEKLKRRHHLKTGRLIDASLHIGLLSAELNNERIKILTPCLKKLALALGLLFQIQDDILDSNTEQTFNTLTYLSLQGLEKAKADCEVLTKEINNQLDVLSQMSYSTDALLQVLHPIIQRHQQLECST